MKAHIENDIVTGGLKIYLFEEDVNGKRSFVRPMDIWFDKTDSAESVEPTLRLDRHYANAFGKALMEALEKAGFTSPENEKGRERQIQAEATLAATKYHLEDMRKIAFEPIKVSA